MTKTYQSLYKNRTHVRLKEYDQNGASDGECRGIFLKNTTLRYFPSAGSARNCHPRDIQVEDRAGSDAHQHFDDEKEERRLE